MVPLVDSSLAKTESILIHLAVASNQSVKMFQMSMFFYFDLTCDVIGDLKVSEIRSRLTVFAGLPNALWILTISTAISEKGGGYG